MKSKSGIQLLNHSSLQEQFEVSSTGPYDHVDESPAYLQATPVRRRDESGSVGSRESSASGDSGSRGMTPRNMLNSSLMSPQSDVVLRRPRNNTTMSAVVGTLGLSSSQERGAAVQLRKASHDVSAFRARQARSEIFTDNWTPGRLGRPRSLDALDKLANSESELTTDNAGAGTVEAFYIRSSPRASPARLRKHRLQDTPPRTPPTNLKMQALLAQSSPSLLRKEMNQDHSFSAAASEQQHTPVTTRKGQNSPPPSPTTLHTTSGAFPVRKLRASPPPSPRSSRSSSLASAGSRGFHVVPVQDPAVDIPGGDDSGLKDPPLPVRVIDSVVTSTVSSPLSSKSPSFDSPRSTVRAHHARERSWSGDRRDSPNGEIYRSFRLGAVRDVQKDDGVLVKNEGSPGEQKREVRRRDSTVGKSPSGMHTRERSTSGERNQSSADNPSRGPSTLPLPQHTRERSTSGEGNQSPADNPSRGPSTLPRPQHSRERSTSGEGNQSPADNPSRGPSTLPRSQHSRERTTSGEKARAESFQEGGHRAPNRKESPEDDTFRISQPAPQHIGEMSGEKKEVLSELKSRVLSKEADDAPFRSPVPGNLRSPPVPQRQETPVLAHYTSTSSITKTDGRPKTAEITTLTRDTGTTSVSTPTRQSSYGTPPLLNGPSPGDSTSAAKVQWQSTAIVESPNESRSKYSEVRDENRNDTKVSTVVVFPGTQNSTQHSTDSWTRVQNFERQTSDEDDARSTASQSVDCSPAVRRQRKAKKAVREKEIFINTPPCSDNGSVASDQKSTEGKQRARSLGSGQADASKKSSVWYEYGCV